MAELGTFPRCIIGLVGWIGLWGIAWLACIVWVAIDAQRRGISPIFWPLVTIIIRPLGLVAHGIICELSRQKNYCFILPATVLGRP